MSPISYNSVDPISISIVCFVSDFFLIILNSPLMFSLYIEYGKEWVDDLLDGMSECSGFLDFPVYCQDGISWSNKLVLGNFKILYF